MEVTTKIQWLRLEAQEESIKNYINISYLVIWVSIGLNQISEKPEIHQNAWANLSIYEAGITCLSTAEKQQIPVQCVTHLCLLDLSYAVFNDPELKET